MIATALILGNMEITLHFDFVLPMLNGSNGMIRGHWAKFAKEKKKLTTLIRSQTREVLKGPVEIEYTRASVTAPDWDNLASSFKYIGDALVNCRVIEDDNPKVVKSFIPRWAKAKNHNSAYTTVKIKTL